MNSTIALPQTFTTSNLTLSGFGSERYLQFIATPTTRPIFVARFKYRSPSANGRAFMRALIASGITPENYFARHDAGETPVGILKSLGFEFSWSDSGRPLWLKS